eukprot:UN34728
MCEQILDKKHGYKKLVVKDIEKRSLDELKDLLFDHCGFIWVSRKPLMVGQFKLSEIFKLHTYQSSKRVSPIKKGIEGTEVLYHKTRLANLLRSTYNNCYFVPASHSILSHATNTFHFKTPETVDLSQFKYWILKPNAGANGTGIQLLSSMPKKDFRALLEKDYDEFKQNTFPLILQQYIHNPLLYDNRKFDIRTYVLILATKPKTTAYFHRGYVRLCGEKYDEKNIKNKQCHITNYHVSRECDGYDLKTDTVDGKSVRKSWEEFCKFLANTKNKCIIENIKKQRTKNKMNKSKGNQKKIMTKKITENDAERWLIE